MISPRSRTRAARWENSLVGVSHYRLRRFRDDSDQMFIKENFWIGAKGGLLEEKHYLCMRESVWLFLFLLLKQTDVNEADEGVVNYGHPITRMRIQEDTGWHERRIEDWIDRLRRTGYIRTESRGQDGLVFFILDAKKKHRVSRNYGMRKSKSSRSNVPLPLKRDTQTIENKNFNGHHTSLPTEVLSSYNKDAAPTAGAVFSALQEVASQMQPQRQNMSQKDLDARRRFLLDQAKQLKEKMPS